MKAKFYDGVEAKSHEISLTFGSRGIIIQDHRHQILESWTYDELAIDCQSNQGQWAVIKSKKHPLKSLIIESKEDFSAFLNHYPYPIHGKNYLKTLVKGLISLVLIFIFLKKFSWEVILPFMSRSWDNRVGQWSETYIEGHNKLCSFPPLSGSFNHLVTKMVQEVPFREKVNVQVLIIDDPSIENAIALPNGKIFVYTGLLKRVHSPEELIGILAHEIGHIYYRHGMVSLMRNITMMSFIKMIEITVFSDASNLNWLTQLTSQLVLLHYSRDLEGQADDFALNLMSKLQVSSKGFADFFQSEQEPQKVIHYLSTHPSDQSRIDHIHRHPSYTIKKGQNLLTHEDWTIIKKGCQ